MWQDYAETSAPTDRYNDRQTNQPTKQQFNQRTDMRGHREVILPKDVW